MEAESCPGVLCLQCWSMCLCSGSLVSPKYRCGQDNAFCSCSFWTLCCWNLGRLLSCTVQKIVPGIFSRDLDLTGLMWSVKASTSSVLSLTHVSSIFLNQWQMGDAEETWGPWFHVDNRYYRRHTREPKAENSEVASSPTCLI